MSTAAIYTRVSTDDQVSNNSLATQLSACQSYANANNLTVIATLSDDETGANINRAGYSELQRLVHERVIDAVIVFSVDRLHRNLANQIASRELLHTAGVALHYVRRGKLDDSPEGTLFDNIDATFAEYERHKIRERTMRGTEGKTKSGKPIGAGRAPYGYRYEGTGQDRILVIEDEQAAIVREIYARYIGGEGVTAIVRDISTRHIPTWSDLHGITKFQRRQRAPYLWNQATLYDILRDALYVGIWYQFRNRKRNGTTTRNHNPGDWVGVPVPAIVDQVTWDAAQHRLNTGRNLSTRNVRYEYGLRSLIRCGACGAAMTGMTQKRPNTQQSYYRCTNRTNKAVDYCTVTLYVRAEFADAAVWQAITALLEPATLAKYVAQRQKSHTTRLAQYQQQRATLDQRKATLTQQIDRLVGLYGKGIIDIDAIERQIAPLREQIADLDNQISTLAPPMEQPAADLMKLASEVRAGFAGAETDIRLRRQLLMILGVQVHAYRVSKKQTRLAITSHLNSEPLTVVV